MRIVLTVAYDGSDFFGWAPQTGRRTVHRTLTEAVRLIGGEDIEIVGASRTDSGAHARGQVCHFDQRRGLPPERWRIALNDRLPSDMSVTSSRAAPDWFHARFGARDRFYRYRIGTGIRDPQRSRYLHSYGAAIDVEKMREAAAHLVGEHDYRAFTEELDPGVINTRRTLHSVDVLARRDEVWVDVVGTAFLRGMMRRMAGSLLEVGRGYRPVEEVSRLLDPEERRNVTEPVVLPAKGLCLMRVRYGRHPRDPRTALSTYTFPNPGEPDPAAERP